MRGSVLAPLIVTPTWLHAPMQGSVDARLLAIAGRQHSAFTRQQALEIGFTPKMIQGRLELGLWRAVYRGVYVISGSHRSSRQAVMAACLATAGVAAGRSAGALYGLVPEGAATAVLVSRSSRRARPGVTVLQTGDIRRGDRVAIDGIPATSVARTIIDLARSLDQDALEMVVDRALTRRLITIERLTRRAERVSSGRPGARTLHKVLAERGPRPETSLERRLLRILQRGGFHEFVPQEWVRVGDERFRIDLLDRRRKVAVEADEDHHREVRQWRGDIRRQTLLVAAGYTFLRFTEQDAREAEMICRRVGDVLARVDTV